MSRLKQYPLTFHSALAPLLLALSMTLSACGGGGSSSRAATPPATVAPPASTPTVSIAGSSVTEGNSGTTNVVLNVTLSASSSDPVSVDFATSDGSANAGSDYNAQSGTVTIAAGATTTSIDLQVTADTSAEPDETFTVTLSNASNANLGTASATVSIRDDDTAAVAVGLSARPANNSCVAPARTTSGAGLSLVDAFPDLPDLAAPMKIIQPVNDNSQWYAVLRSGGMDRFANDPAVNNVERYLNLTVATSGEGGFLSAVLHPDWPTTREMYVSYTEQNGGFKSVLSRLVITDDSTLPATYVEERLLTVDQPFTNHNGGDIAFGPDGLLYYSMGDGGDGGDPLDYGQNTTRLLGTIMRIAVNGVAFPSPGYTIPAGNPFSSSAKCGPGANGNNCPEIFAWGLRNPWRMSFDSATGTLWTGDVGQGAREEVDIIRAGENYGWRCREGSQVFNSSGCAASGFTDPVFDYGRASGDRSITGGFVYRSSTIPELLGKYLFADFASGRVWSLENQSGTYVREELASTSAVAGLSQGNDGDVYVLDIGGGRIRHFASAGGTMNDNVADSLAATGCFDSADPSIPASGLIPYQPAAPFWSDGADKARWVALPDSGTVDATSGANWTFPTGTVIAKHFELGSQLIETRLFMRHPDGAWAGYTYRWNDAETAATRVRNGETRNVGGQTWVYPSEGQCLSCHTQASGYVLGLETAQLNGDFTYPSTGITDNQLEVFNHINLFSNDVAEPVSNLPALANPADTSASIDARARAYLHTNCAQCHQPGTPSGTDLDLRFDVDLAATNTCNVAPQAGTLGIANARLIAPGDPGRSVLLARTNRRDADAMPPIASNEIDTAGVTLLTDWINSISTCP
ncbi:MAG: PQQ-dependent sugar dehydrogenase [Pseudomonadales bacterium]